jgi:hypothetical protein
VPAVPTTTCPHGHTIRTSADRSQGYCRECKRSGDRDQRLRRRAALDVVRIFEAAGVQFQDNGRPIAADEVARQLMRVYADSPTAFG